MNRQNIVFLGGLFLVILIAGMLFSNTVSYNIEGLDVETDGSGARVQVSDSTSAGSATDTTTITSDPAM